MVTHPFAGGNAAGDQAHSPGARLEAPGDTRVDHRQQLCNAGEAGPMEQVSLPEAMITSLRGILLDFDPQLFRSAPCDPARLHGDVLRPMLGRHPVLQKAEVRVSGRGLHAIVWFEIPVEFNSEADRQRWAAVVKVIQCLLPTAPDCPGITALTRPLGSINGKNGVVVRQLNPGKRVPAEEVVALFDLARGAPFRTVAGLLFGDGPVVPCPVCGDAGRRLDALDRVGKCYGGCGKVRLAQLFDVYLKPRPCRAEG